MSNEKTAIFSAKVISQARITIPEEIRILHNIEEGDIITMKIVNVAKQNMKKEKINHAR